MGNGLVGKMLPHKCEDPSSNPQKPHKLGAEYTGAVGGRMEALGQLGWNIQ